MINNMTHNTTHDMKQFDMMIHPSLSYRHSTLRFTRCALRLAAVLLGWWWERRVRGDRISTNYLVF